MGRRSFTSLLNQMAREAARQQRLAEAEQRRRLRSQIQADRAAERQQLLEAKEAKQQYIESRMAEAEDATEELTDRVEELADILNHTLSVNDVVSFDDLKAKDEFPPFGLVGSDVPSAATLPTRDAFVSSIKPPGFLGKVMPHLQARYQQAMEQAELDYQAALTAYEAHETERQRQLQIAFLEYEQKKAEHLAEVAALNQEIENFKASYAAGDPAAVVAYCSMVLERSDYPEEFPQEFRVAYVPESKQVVVDYELPLPAVIPDAVEYRYVKSRDEIQPKPRKQTEIRELYQDVVAAVTLRTCHELFEADQARHFDAVAFNGFVQVVDRATGNDIRPYLISLRVTRERFSEIDLSRVDKRVCLRNLGAQVSQRPDDVQPIKPLVDFDMIDRRFVEQSDILADLESRPNLMDLNPFEFENLVSNLFKELGLETKLTRSRRDGGVDVVAFDLRPVLGGKVVIQAKRYKNTVGVSAVRDLYGTMMNEGANKGILVTTSGYGPDAFDFAKDKPIELIHGGQLLYLLDQCGVKARIVFPDEG